MEYLYQLSAADGADQTRDVDEGRPANDLRNGEPLGEMGLVMQKDFDWKAQTGAPDDPQPGNIPGGSRDVLRGADFNAASNNVDATGSLIGFGADSGGWNVSNGRLEVSPTALGGDAASVFYVDSYLPVYYEVQATINAAKPLAGSKSNAYLIFDYVSPTDFKFAGINISTNKIEMGHRTATDWVVDVQTPAQVKPDQDYNLLLSVNGLIATLVIDNAQLFSFAYAATVDEFGVTRGLNRGMVGLGAQNSSARIDNLAVQVLPAQYTLVESETFNDGVADRFTSLKTGSWTIQNGVYIGTPAVGETRAFSDVGILIATPYVFKFGALLNTTTVAGIVFDQYSADDFKFAAISVETNQIILGHNTARGGLRIDANIAATLIAGQNYQLDVSLKGTGASVALNGAAMIAFVYNASTVDGKLGLFTERGTASFDSVSLTTNDLAYQRYVPVAMDDALSGNEDTPIQITAAQLLANDSDRDNDPLSVTNVTQPSHGTVTAAAGGGWIYMPAANYFGTDAFSYTITDGREGTAIAFVLLTIASVNDIPVPGSNALSTNEDTAVQFTAAQLLANDTDADGDILSVSSLAQPAHGVVTANATGGWTYTPSLNYNGADSFGYTVTDGKGGLATASITVTIATVNDAPMAGNNTLLLNEDTSIQFTAAQLLANDTDVEGDVLSVTAVTQPGHGAVSANAGGGWTYTPVANYNGTDSFSYSISDGKGGVASASVIVTIASVNDAPVAGNSAMSTNEDVALQISAAQLLANDTDVDGDVLTITGITQPSHGAVTANGAGAWIYTPAANYFGSDSFTYSISDGKGGASSASVTLTIVSVNDAPVAGNNTLTTNEDTSVAVTAAQLLANDSDVDGDVLSVTAVTQPGHGAVTANAGGGWIYTPAANYNGADSFTYTVSDGKGGVTSASVNVTIVAVNDAPVTAADTFTTDKNTAITITAAQLLANDRDVDGDAISVTSVTQPAHGVLTQTTTGIWNYTPVAGYAGTDVFTYTVSDGKGGAGTGQASIKVRQTYSATPNLALADNATTRTTITVSDIATVRDINVRLSLTHPALNQLSVYMVGPTGLRIQLIGSLIGANLSSTTLDDEATTLVSAGSAPYTGVFRSIGNLTLFEGTQLNGTWTLEVTDSTRGSTGTLSNWAFFVEV
jgi:VCBS repeat-containing protein